MRTFLALLAFALFWGIDGYAQPDGAPITLHMPNTTLQKILDTLRTNQHIVFSTATDPHKYRHIHLWVDNASLETVLSQSLEGLSLTFRTSRFRDTLMIDIFPIRTPAIPKRAGPRPWHPAARPNIYENLPAYTLSTSFNNGYEQVKIASTTGSYSSETMAEITRVLDPDLFPHLDGQLSGLTMGSVRNPLGFSVCGNSTFMGTGTPLIVVDKFAYAGNIDDLNPYDLGSVTVLKDAVAAGVWGAYSGNGVLVLSSRDGQYDKAPLLTVTMNTTVRGKPALSYQPRMSSADYITADSILYRNHFYDAYFNDPLFAIPPSVEVLHKVDQGLLDAAEGNSGIAAMRSHDVMHDLDHYYYQPGVSQQIHLSVEGGRPHSKYYIGAGYDHNPTDLVRNSFQRYTVHSVYTLGTECDRLQVVLSGNLAGARTLNNNAGDIPVTYPYAQLADGSGRPLAVTYKYNPAFLDTINGSFPVNWNYRPLQELALADNRNGRQDMYLQATIGYRLSRSLRVEASGRWMHGHSFSRDVYNKDGFYVRDLVNQFSQPVEGGTGFQFPVPDAGIVTTADTDLLNYNGRLQLSFHDTADANHVWIALAGAEVNDAEISGQTQQIYGYDGPAGMSRIDYVDPFPVRPEGLQATIPDIDGFLAQSNRSVSFFSNLAYTWKRQWNIYSAFRLDGANIVGGLGNRKWGPFWSLGVSRSLNAGLKLRASYGCNGNASNRTSDLQIAYLGYNTYGAAQNGIEVPPDPTLGWERVNILNLGLDYGFFRDRLVPRGRLSGSLDLYQRWAVNLLSLDTLAPSAGIPSYMGNTAGISGQGIDLVVRSVNVLLPLRKRFSWVSTLLLGFHRDEVSSYPYQARSPASYVTGGFYQVGKPSTALFSYRWAGLNAATGDPQGFLGGKPGSSYYSLINDPAAARVCSGVWQPVITASLLNSFSLGHWSFSARFDCRTGYVFRRASIDYYQLAMNRYRGTRDFADRWQYPGQKTNVPSMPVVPDYNRDLFYANSAALITRADNLRWRDLNLGYEWVPAQGPVKSALFYIYVDNIAIVWRANHQGIDPDAAQFGQTPALRSYSFGVRLKF